MMQLSAFIRPVTTNFLKVNAFKMTLFSPRVTMKFHTLVPSACKAIPDKQPTIPRMMKEFEWLQDNLEAERQISIIIPQAAAFLQVMVREHKKSSLIEKPNALDFYRSGRPLKKWAAVSAVSRNLQANVREQLSLYHLRTELFLRFRLTVRQIVEPKLSAKVKMGHSVLNYENAHSDYSLFLEQFWLDVELGNLDSFLSGIGIVNAREFYEICEFALKGDQEAFFQLHPSWIYYMMEEEVGDVEEMFPQAFDKKGILRYIGRVKYSESMPKNCVKMTDYMSKLI